MNGSDKQLNVMSEYKAMAFRSVNIPKQHALENPGSFVKPLEGSDLIERLAWGRYSVFNIHERPKYAEAYQTQKKVGIDYQRVVPGPTSTNRKI